MLKYLLDTNIVIYTMNSTVVSSHYGNLKNSKHSDLTICEKK